MTRIGVWIATAGGLGYAPVAPGTFGSAAGVVIYLLTSDWPWLTQVALAAGVTVIGTWAAHVASTQAGQSDPSHVVIDEVAGQLVTYLGTGVGWKGALIGFLLFRVLDIVKPWPANKLEALHGGVGIMADDVMAAIYGCALLHGLIWLAPQFKL